MPPALIGRGLQTLSRGARIHQSAETPESAAIGHVATHAGSPAAMVGCACIRLREFERAAHPSMTQSAGVPHHEAMLEPEPAQAR